MENKEPKLYSKKSKILIAVAAAIVVALTVLCIVFISKSFNKPDEVTTAQTETDNIPQGYKPVDTSIVSDDTGPEDQTGTDSYDDTTSSPETDTQPVSSDTQKQAGDTDGPVQSDVVTSNSETSPEPEENGVKLTNDIVLVKLEKYSGPFVEDGSDEQVENIVSAVVKNTGDTAVQMLEFSVETDSGEAEFFATTLLPHTVTVVLERNRMSYPEGAFGIAKLTQIGNFIEEPSFFFDVFDINGSDGTLVIRNKTSDDITGKVAVYYKTVKDGRYFGGITYQATLNGGIPSGETMLLGASHFRIDDSRVVFVKYD